jgi:hypothetical protein
VEDVLVSGRNIQEVKEVVHRWMEAQEIRTVEEADDFVRGRMGPPSGAGLTAPKFFEVSFKPKGNTVLVHMEGWISTYGEAEQGFSKGAFFGGIPRRKGWSAMEKLWNGLKSLSK